MSIISALAKSFRKPIPPSPVESAEAQLEIAQHSLLEQEALAEYHAAMCEMLEVRINRLNAFISKDSLAFSGHISNLSDYLPRDQTNND